MKMRKQATKSLMITVFYSSNFFLTILRSINRGKVDVVVKLVD